MKFCIKCDNMYYIKIKDDNENQLTYYCRNCGYVDETLAEEGTCVLNTNLAEESVQSYDHIINKYTKLDPTLPRLYNLKCPNTNCSTNKNNDEDNLNSNTEVIYIRYNEKDMKYLYLCTTCDYVWKTNEN
jgi:DNA-directed RNA polymerase subunit M/transcription elongation factor TFIIS